MKSSTGLQLVAGMGSGKSITTLTAIVDLLAAGTIRAAIVIAPVRVAMTTWPNEISSWEHTKHLDAVVLAGSPAKRLKMLREQHEVYICSIDNLVWLIDALRKFAHNDPRWDMLVIDELSRFKSARGERAKKLNRFSERFDAVIGLTGTPRPNGWHEQWMPLNIISGGEAWGTGYDGWLEEHFKPLDYQKRKWEIRPEHVDRVQRVIDTWSMTIPHDEATDIPFNFGPDHDVIVPLTKAQEADLASLEEELLVELGADGADLLDPSEDLLVALSQATASGKMSQICQGFLYRDGETLQTYGKAKLDALNDLLEGINGENVMIAYHYRHDLEVLRGRFGQGVPTLGSDTDEDQAAAWINAWNAGEIPELLFHPACLHPETSVLTEFRGWVKIVDVRSSERVFDGEEFVSHGGCQFSGLKPVIDVFGVLMTEDHKLLIGDRWVEARDVRDTESVRGEARYAYAGDDPRIGALFDVRDREHVAGAERCKSEQTETKELPDVPTGQLSPNVEHPILPDMATYAKPGHRPSITKLPQVRAAHGTRNVSEVAEVSELLPRYVRHIYGRPDAGESGQQEGVLQDQLPVGYEHGAASQQVELSIRGVPRRAYALGRVLPPSQGEPRGDYGVPQRGCRRRSSNGSLHAVHVPEEQKKPKVPVYDLVDCGPRNRFLIRNDAGEVFVSHNSASHGLNLQHGGRRMIWYCNTWSPELFAQACKRLARPGQKDPVFVHRILADHWYEQRRVQRVEAKMAEEAEFITTLRRI